MDLQQIGNRVRVLRREQGLTQEDLAERANISVSFVSHIERGTKRAGLKSLVHIAAALQVTLDQLLGGYKETEWDMLAADVYDLLQDCSQKERQIIVETSRTLKRALREYRSD